MSLKNIIRTIVTRVNCLIWHIDYKEDVYLGLGCKLSGGGKIIIGRSVHIMPNSLLFSHKSGKIEICDGATISMYSRVAAADYVKIGKDVEMGPGCFIADYNHEYRDVRKPVKKQGNMFVKMRNGVPNLEIGDDSWIGAHVVIAGNVKIGKHCVIGANSVVTHDIPDYCVAAGSPARVIKRYDFNKKEWILLKN